MTHFVRRKRKPETDQHYEPPTFKQLEALRQIAAAGEDGLPPTGFRIGGCLTRAGLAERVEDCSPRYFLTRRGIEALEIERTGRRRWSVELGRWVPKDES